MKLPAVAITAAFADGIAFGLYSPLAHHAASPAFLAGCFFVPLLLVLAGIFLTRFQRLLPAAAASLLAWFSMGILGARIADQPRPTDHVISLADAGRIDLKTPLRWHGRLRDEPARLPWGYSYEIALSGVDYENKFVAAKGGLRLSFTPQPGQPPLPELHAGDELAVVTQARLPQVYKDEGVFDRRAYLAQQNIDLIATLRAPELIEHAATPAPGIGIALARWRRRAEIDELFPATSQACCVPCSWATAALLTERKPRTFKRRAYSTCSWWQVCTSARWPFSYSG